MSKSIALIVGVIGLTGCDAGQVPYARDQCLRTTLFQACLAAVPVGPQTTVENQWAEVVKQCESAAFYQSIRPTASIKAECAILR